MAAYEIYQRTVGGMRGDVIDKFTRFTASLAFNDVGKWQLDGASTSGCPLSENDGIIIYRDGDPFLSGYVTDISEEVDETFEGGQIVSWTVQGNDDNGLLTRRILFPDPVELDITTQAYHTIRDYAGNTILKYIDYHAGEHAASGRQIPNFTIDSYKDLGTIKTWNARFDVLWDFIVTIANQDNLGIKVVWSDIVGKYIASVYAPQDKSDLIIFSREYGNIKKWAHTRSAPKANAIWVAGQGEETERMISYREDADSIAKWGRYEGFKDRRDISNEQDENDPRTPQEVLDDIAEALIPENKETDTYELELTPINRMSYLDDWNLGDIVKIRLGAIEFNSIINAISIDYQGGVETITPSVGTIDRGTAGKTYSTIQSISDRVEVLEKNEGGGAGSVIELLMTHTHNGTNSKKIAASNVDGLADYFDASTGHDHDGTDSKKIAYSNIVDTPAFETSASNIKPDGTASAGSLSTIARADHVHPQELMEIFYFGGF